MEQQAQENEKFKKTKKEEYESSKNQQKSNVT